MGNKMSSSSVSSSEVSKESAKTVMKVPEPKIESKSKKEDLHSKLSKKPDNFYVEPTDDGCVQVAVIGNEGVGKSSIVTQYIEGKFVMQSNSAPQGSLRFFNRSEEIFDEVKNLKIYDLIGNEDWSKIKSYMGSLEGVLIVFDLTNPQSFEDAKELCKLVKTEIKELTPEKDINEEEEHHDDDGESEIGVSLLGNKVDDKENRKVKKEDAEKLAFDMGFEYMETSAKENINIKSAFVGVLEQTSPFPL